MSIITLVAQYREIDERKAAEREAKEKRDIYLDSLFQSQSGIGIDGSIQFKVLHYKDVTFLAPYNLGQLRIESRPEIRLDDAKTAVAIIKEALAIRHDDGSIPKAVEALQALVSGEVGDRKNFTTRLILNKDSERGNVSYPEMVYWTPTIRVPLEIGVWSTPLTGLLHEASHHFRTHAGLEFTDNKNAEEREVRRWENEVRAILGLPLRTIEPEK